MSRLRCLIAVLFGLLPMTGKLRAHLRGTCVGLLELSSLRLVVLRSWLVYCRQFNR